MFATISSAAGPFGLAALVLLALAVMVGYLFYRLRDDIDPVHKGKAPTHKCKFDQKEVASNPGIMLSLPDPAVLLPVDPRVVQAHTKVEAKVVKDALLGLTGEIPVTVSGSARVISSRNSYGQGVEFAMLYLEDFYRKLGIKTTRDPYTVWGKTYYNLVAELPGKVNPDQVLIIGAHLDSTAGRTRGPEPVAPGADDDASGTVSLMEIAKALVELPLGATVRLVHFTGEEQGLYGSYAYSDKVSRAKTKLIAMIQLDMVGYCAKPGNRLDIHDAADRNGSHSLAVHFGSNVSRYGLKLKPVDTHNHAVEDRSDHAGFLDHGFKAVLLSEEFTDDGFNPNYHSVDDKVGSINLEYLVEVIRLTIATACDLAELVSP